MLYEFDDFTVDGECRELTFRGREVALQPKAFELLLFLLEHRERVVDKRELLDALWPDVVVADGSLKRAVSLVRSALRVGGAEGVIRTYQRQGYRFCGSVDERVPASERELSTGAGADTLADQTAEALERAGLAARRAGRLREACEPIARAVGAFAARGEHAAAARCSLHVAQLHFELAEFAVGRGWLLRGASYLPTESEGPEHGYHAWSASRYALIDGDFDQALRWAEAAQSIGRRLSDANIEAMGLLYKGLVLCARGDVQHGCAHHDEAAAAVLSTEIDPWVGGLVYCGMISTCRNRADWRRASEWTERFFELCSREGFSGVLGTCRLHHADLLHANGALAEAEREVRAVSVELATQAPRADGDAQNLLGDVLLARGALVEAEAAYREAHELGWDPQPGLALLEAARGRPQVGMLALQRALGGAGWHVRQRRGLLLAHLVPIALAADCPEVARETLAELERSPELWQTPALQGVVAEARAAFAEHEGDSESALRELRHAATLHREAGSTLSVVRVRLRLGGLLLAAGDPVGAELELAAAAAGLRGRGAEPLERELLRLRARVAAAS